MNQTKVDESETWVRKAAVFDAEALHGACFCFFASLTRHRHGRVRHAVVVEKPRETDTKCRFHRLCL